MCRSKHLRLWCLLLSFLLVFASFGLTVSAADDDTNLVNSDLRLWSSSENVDVVKQSSGLFYIRTNGASLNGKYLLVGSVFDSSKVKSGDSFSISFYLPKYEETNFTWTEDKYFSQFNSANGSFFVGLAYLDSQGSPVFYDNYYDELNEEDFRQYAGKEYTYTFTVDKISGTPYVMLAYVGTSSSNVGYVSLGSVSFVNNDEADEEGFFSRLFDWFQEKFNDIGSWFSELGKKIEAWGEDFGSKMESLSNDVGQWFSDLWSSIKDGFSDSVQNVTNNFTDLGTDLTGKFDSVGTWFSDLKDSIVSKFQAIGDAITSKLKEVGESITTKFQEIGDKFTEFFDKFKPRVYEEFSWYSAYVDASNGKVYDLNFSAGGSGYTLTTDFFEVPSGTTYLLDYDLTAYSGYSGYFRVFKYDASEKYLSYDTIYPSYDSSLIEGYTLDDGYKYIFEIRFSSNYPEEDLINDVSNSIVKVYADEGWINALIHKLQSVIKNLFVPDEAYIAEWKGSLEALCADHLGIIYDLPDFLTGFFGSVRDLLANSKDDELDFTLPAVSFDLNGEHIELWKDNKVDMSFLSTNGFFKTLYGMYKVILYISLIFALFKYVQKVGERTMTR